ncbi:antitoxin [Brachybacterium sp. GCM10030267]|uniref:antitoxin n=1 Tax=unclassified Brachybacterium TaxID=2623841 RepID=UPI003608EB16
MGFDDALNKAKDFAGENSEQAEQGIDAAAEQIKERTPDQFDEQVDSGADAARDQLGLGGDENQGGN